MATKSFSLKIGADTSDFIKGLKQADRAIKATEKEAKELKNGLKLDFDAKRFQSAQALAQRALAQTEEKAEAIRKELDYIAKNGGVDTEGYSKLQNELTKTENKAILLKNELKEIDNIKMANATKGIDNLSSSLTKAGNATKGLSLAAAGAIAGITKLGLDAVKTGDEIQTTADKYSLSAEEIQKWNYIALQSDVASEQMYKGIAKVRDAVGTALVGKTNNATNAIEQLGLNIQELGTADETFYEIITAMANIEDSTMQAYYANEIFGEKMATDLIPLIKKGSGALAELSEEFQSVGYLSDDQVKSLSKFDDELNKIKTQLSITKAEIGMAFLPALKTLAKFLNDTILPALKRFAEWFGELPEPVQNTILAITGLVAILSPVLLIGGKILSLVSSLIKGIPSLTKVITTLGTATARTMIGVASLVTALMLINDVMANWGNMNTIQKVVSVLGTLTVVALGAAVALGAFHSAWSLGLAVAGIIAGIVAVTAAVNKAKDSISTDIPSISTPSLSGSSSGQVATNATTPQYNVDTNYGIGETGTSNIDNSQNTYNIEIQSNEYMNAEQLVEAVSKKLVLKKQARS